MTTILDRINAANDGIAIPKSSLPFVTATAFRKPRPDDENGPAFVISDYLALIPQEKLTWNVQFESWLRKTLDQLFACNIDYFYLTLSPERPPTNVPIGTQFSAAASALVRLAVSLDPYVLVNFLVSQSGDASLKSSLSNTSFVGLNLWVLRRRLQGGSKDFRDHFDRWIAGLPGYHRVMGKFERNEDVRILSAEGGLMDNAQLIGDMDAVLQQAMPPALATVTTQRPQRDRPERDIDFKAIFAMPETGRGNLRDLGDMLGKLQTYLEHIQKLRVDDDAAEQLRKAIADRFVLFRDLCPRMWNYDGIGIVNLSDRIKVVDGKKNPGTQMGTAQWATIGAEASVPRDSDRTNTRSQAQYFMGRLYADTMLGELHGLASKSVAAKKFVQFNTLGKWFALGEFKRGELDPWHDANLASRLVYQVDTTRYHALWGLLRDTTTLLPRLARGGNIPPFQVITFLRLCVVLGASELQTEDEINATDILLDPGLHAETARSPSTRKYSVWELASFFASVFLSMRQGSMPVVTGVLKLRTDAYNKLVRQLLYVEMMAVQMAEEQSPDPSTQALLRTHMAIQAGWAAQYRDYMPFGGDILWTPAMEWLQRNYLDFLLQKQTVFQNFQETLWGMNTPEMGTLIRGQREGTLVKPTLFLPYRELDSTSELEDMRQMLENIELNSAIFKSIVGVIQHHLQLTLKGFFPKSYIFKAGLPAALEELMTIHHHKDDDTEDLFSLKELGALVTRIGNNAGTIAKLFHFRLGASSSGPVDVRGIRAQIDSQFQRIICDIPGVDMAGYIQAFRRALNDYSTRFAQFVIDDTELPNLQSRNTRGMTELPEYGASKFTLLYAIVAATVPYLEKLLLRIERMYEQAADILRCNMGSNARSNLLSVKHEHVSQLIMQAMRWMMGVHVDMVEQDKLVETSQLIRDTVKGYDARYLPEIVSHNMQDLERLAKDKAVLYKDIFDRANAARNLKAARTLRQRDAGQLRKDNEFLQMVLGPARPSMTTQTPSAREAGLRLSMQTMTASYDAAIAAIGTFVEVDTAGNERPRDADAILHFTQRKAEMLTQVFKGIRAIRDGEHVVSRYTVGSVDYNRVIYNPVTKAGDLIGAQVDDDVVTYSTDRGEVKQAEDAIQRLKNELTEYGDPQPHLDANNQPIVDPSTGIARLPVPGDGLVRAFRRRWFARFVKRLSGNPGFLEVDALLPSPDENAAVEAIARRFPNEYRWWMMGDMRLAFSKYYQQSPNATVKMDVLYFGTSVGAITVTRGSLRPSIVKQQPSTTLPGTTTGVFPGLANVITQGTQPTTGVQQPYLFSAGQGSSAGQTAMNDEITRLKKEIARLDSDNTELILELKRRQDSDAKTQLKIDMSGDGDKDKQIRDLKRDLKVCEEGDKSAFQLQLTAIQNKSNGEIKKLQDRIKELQDMLDQCEQDLRNCKHERTQLKSEVKIPGSSIPDAQSGLQAANDKARAAEKERERLRGELSKVNLELVQVKQEKTTAEDRLRKWDAAATAVQRQIGEVRLILGSRGVMDETGKALADRKARGVKEAIKRLADQIKDVGQNQDAAIALYGEIARLEVDLADAQVADQQLKEQVISEQQAATKLTGERDLAIKLVSESKEQFAAETKAAQAQAKNEIADAQKKIDTETAQAKRDVIKAREQLFGETRIREALTNGIKRALGLDNEEVPDLVQAVNNRLYQLKLMVSSVERALGDIKGASGSDSADKINSVANMLKTARDDLRIANQRLDAMEQLPTQSLTSTATGEMQQLRTRIAQLETQLQASTDANYQLGRTNASLASQLQNVQNDLKLANENLATAREATSQAQKGTGTVAKAKKTTGLADESIAKLQRQLNDLRAQGDTASKAQVEQLQLEVQRLQTGVEELNIANLRLRNNLAIEEIRIEEKESALQEARRTAKEAQQQLFEMGERPTQSKLNEAEQKLKVATDSLKRLTEEKDSGNQDVVNLRGQLEESRRQLNVAKNELGQTAGKLAESRRELTESSSQLTEVQRKNTALETQLQQAQRDRRLIDAQLEKLTSDLQTGAISRQKLEQQLGETNANILFQQSQILELQNQLKTRPTSSETTMADAEEVARLKAQNDAQIRSYNQLETEFRRLQSGNQTLTAQNDELTRKFNEQAQRATAFLQQLQQLTQSGESTSASHANQVTGLETQLSGLRSANQHQVTQISELTGALQAATNTIKNLEGEKAAMKQAMDQLGTAVKQLQDTKSFYDSLPRELRERHGTLIEQAAAIQKLWNTIQIGGLKARETLGLTRINNPSADQLIDWLSRYITQTERLASDSTDVISDLRTRLEQFRLANQALTSDVDRLKSENAGLMARIDELQQLLNMDQARLDSLSRREKTLERGVQQLWDTVQILTRQEREAREGQASTSTQLARKTVTADTLEADLKETSDQLSVLTTDLGKLHLEHTALKATESKLRKLLREQGGKTAGMDKERKEAEDMAVAAYKKAVELQHKIRELEVEFTKREENYKKMLTFYQLFVGGLAGRLAGQSGSQQPEMPQLDTERPQVPAISPATGLTALEQQAAQLEQERQDNEARRRQALDDQQQQAERARTDRDDVTRMVTRGLIPKPMVRAYLRRGKGSSKEETSNWLTVDLTFEIGRAYVTFRGGGFLFDIPISQLIRTENTVDRIRSTPTLEVDQSDREGTTSEVVSGYNAMVIARIRGFNADQLWSVAHDPPSGEQHAQFDIGDQPPQKKRKEINTTIDAAGKTRYRLNPESRHLILGNPEETHGPVEEPLIEYPLAMGRKPNPHVHVQHTHRTLHLGRMPGFDSLRGTLPDRRAVSGIRVAVESEATWAALRAEMDAIGAFAEYEEPTAEQ